jgi:hypothetical protein
MNTTTTTGAGAPTTSTADTRTNTRPLAAIAADIHKAERRSIFEIGDLLLEAKAACKHGEWLGWLETEFEWSADTAGRYMKVAELGSKFRTLRNLRLAATTLYDLGVEKVEHLPTIIEALAKDAAKKQISAGAAYEIIWRARERHRWGGNYPDATLSALEDLDDRDPWYGDAVAALKTQVPATEEEANAIVASFKPVGDAADEDVAPAETVSTEIAAKTATADKIAPVDYQAPITTGNDIDVQESAEAEEAVDEAATETTEPAPAETAPTKPATAKSKAASKREKNRRRKIAGWLWDAIDDLDKVSSAVTNEPALVDADLLDQLQTKAAEFIELARRAKRASGGGQ